MAPSLVSPATSGRADLTAMRTTIWRPNVRVTLDEYGEVEDTERGGEEMTKQGTKRKSAVNNSDARGE